MPKIYTSTEITAIINKRLEQFVTLPQDKELDNWTASEKLYTKIECILENHIVHSDLFTATQAIKLLGELKDFFDISLELEKK